GWYCLPCESFYPESQLSEGRLCPECGRRVKKVREESYFFRLSKYQNRLLEYVEENPDFVLPLTRRNEVIEFIKKELKDISVSRLRLEWGIPCPMEEKHTIYVWIDALINYISAIGYSADERRFSSLWPADVQLVGKDILKFHAIIWPSLLMALGLRPPRRIFAHGWWMTKGEKMSKSRGNVIDPDELVKRYGPDSLRYFLLREVPFGEDGNFSPSLFIKRINSDLANDLGNLLNRTLPLVERHCRGRVPYPEDEGQEDGKIKEKTRQVLAQLDERMNSLSFSEALSLIWEIVRAANLYMDRCAPWRLAKEGKRKRLYTVLYNLLETLHVLGVLLYPFIPCSAEKMWTQLGIQKDLSKQRWEEIEHWGRLTPGIEIKRGSPLFPRING
ncbi:MAG: methionine--tRNA ligase, partial [Candidatus Aerophobetes bacterium]|nr:methionine--tRNA ligase [Candidatus Aerophobetes bacterium]